MTIQFKPGDDLSWVGQITQDEVVDFTGYSLASQIKKPACKPGRAPEFLAQVDVQWVDATAGIFSFNVPRGETEDWPVGVMLLLDVRVESPDGLWSRTETGQFQTVQGITEGS